MDEVTPSDEQCAIIDAILNKQNVIVDAVAGSGKTSLVFMLACKLQPILQITYNANLKSEVRTTAAKIGINVEIHTYHSLCLKYYGKRTDDAMITANSLIRKPPKPAVVVIDEAQDMKPLYLKFLRNFLTDSNITAPLLIMGDHQQCIYEFTGADARFLTHADQLWARPFIRLPLNTSYRITAEIAQFVSLISGRRINTIKSGPNVQYIYGKLDQCTHYIVKLLESYAPNDVFVLFPSAKNSLAVYLENILVKKGVPCYFTNREHSSNDKVTNNKIYFTTMHQAKGCQRKIVIIYNFDSSYEFYAKNKLPQNIHYVAMTRASELLIVIHLAGNHSFVSNESIIKCTNYTQLCDITVRDPKPPFSSTSVTDLVRYSDACVKYNILQKPHTLVDVPHIVQFGDNFEEVLDLIGIAIPAYYEFLCTKQCRLGDISNPLDIIKYANKQQSEQSKVHFKMAQILDYSWFTQDMLDAFITNFSIIGSNLIFEVPVDAEVIVAGRHIKINGRIDAMSEDTIYEFKCSDSLTPEHFLQLATYAFLLEYVNENPTNFSTLTPKVLKNKYILFNYRSGERAQLDCDILPIMESLLLKKSNSLSDLEFITINI